MKRKWKTQTHDTNLVELKMNGEKITKIIRSTLYDVLHLIINEIYEINSQKKTINTQFSANELK